MKFSVLWRFCVFSCGLADLVSSQAVTCDYKDESFYDSTSPNIHYYTCVLYASNLNYGSKPTAIEGRHQGGKSDEKVKYLKNYNKDFSNIQRLYTFSSIYCSKFKNLEAIVAEKMQIEQVDEDSFRNCNNLKHLELIGNNFRQLPENLFAGNGKLEKLSITENKQLSSLPRNILASQSQLNDLSLNKNNLEKIDPKWFESLQNVEELKVQNNKLTEVPQKSFQFMRSLKKLWLGWNRIATLHSDSFDGLGNLDHLYLWNNQISDLPQNVFSQLKTLSLLSLSSNKLTTIHSDSIGSLPRLWRIYLDSNLLSSIDEKVVDSTGVSELWLDKNVCSNDRIYNQGGIKPRLRTCFANYRPRSQAGIQQVTAQPRPQIVTRPKIQFTQQSRLQTTTRPSPPKAASTQRPRPTQSPVQWKSTQPPINQKQSTVSCGRSTNAKGNVIGGSFIEKGAYPWLAVLALSNGEYFCGGALISSRKVVTAAHCMQNKGQTEPRLERNFLVSLGTHDLKVQIDPDRANYAVEKVHIHPEWNPKIKQWDADISVLYLARDVAFTEFIQPICLIPAGSPAERQVNGNVVGYGKSEDTSKKYENIPKILNMPIIDKGDCLTENPSWAPLASKRTFCAGRRDGHGICNGDSGSGFFVNYGGIFYLRGIVSASLFDSLHNCDVESYSLLTDVLKFNDWIESVGGNPHFYSKK